MRTFFDAVFLVSLEFLRVFVLVGDTRSAVIVVVFVAVALRGKGTFYRKRGNCVSRCTQKVGMRAFILLLTLF